MPSLKFCPQSLDFSQIKPIQDIEKNPWVKQIIEQAITERLADAINSKDLDDVKKLVEDNCFINRAIVTAALRGVIPTPTAEQTIRGNGK